MTATLLATTTCSTLCYECEWHAASSHILTIRWSEVCPGPKKMTCVIAPQHHVCFGTYLCQLHVNARQPLSFPVAEEHVLSRRGPCV